MHHTIFSKVVKILTFISGSATIPRTAVTGVNIEANPVKLGTLKGDGPKRVNEQVTWTLDINSYGENTCFKWTFTNMSFVAVFGRTACQSLMPGYVNRKCILYISLIEALNFIWKKNMYWKFHYTQCSSYIICCIFSLNFKLLA